MRNERVITFGKYFNKQFSYAVNASIKSFRKYQNETPSVSIIKQCVHMDNVWKRYRDRKREINHVNESEIDCVCEGERTDKGKKRQRDKQRERDSETTESEERC